MSVNKHLTLYKEILKALILTAGLIFSTITISLPSAFLIAEMPSDDEVYHLLLENDELGVLLPAKEIKYYGKIWKEEMEDNKRDRIIAYVMFILFLSILLCFVSIASLGLSSYIYRLESEGDNNAGND